MQLKSVNGVLIGMALAMTLACSETKAPDVTENVRHALDGAGLSDVPQWSPQNRPFVDGSKPAIRNGLRTVIVGASHSARFLIFPACRCFRKTFFTRNA